MNKHLYVSILLTLLSTGLFAQCIGDADADAFPKKVCAPGGTVNLLGSVVGGSLQGVSWFPNIGLSDPNSLNTTANVNFPITYTLTAKVLTNNNVINNGDFGGGNTGFFSNYIHNPTTLWDEGTYAVGSNPQSLHPNFAPCGDHTTGSGNMMIVNGAGIAGQNVYCQVVNVNPNSDYVFSIWVASVISASPAQFQFSVNGMLLGGVLNAPAATCSWTNFTAVWQNPGVSSALICIVNQNTALSGNDFAIDDIEFIEICKDTAQVHIDVVNVDALVLPAPIISCSNPVVDVDGSLSTSGPNISYSWFTQSGNIVSSTNTPVIQVDKPGTYELTVTYDDGDIVCEKKSSINVAGDATIPNAVADPDYYMSCNQDSVTIDASGSTGGNGFTVFWNTPNGNIVSGTSSLTPVVNQPGQYILTILSTLSGCKDTVVVNVHEDRTIPIAVAEPMDTLNCRSNDILLNGQGSSNGPVYSYQWRTSNGNIVQGGNTLTPRIDQPGLYQIIVQNDLNGCLDTAYTRVVLDRNYPVAALDTTPMLTCVVNELDINTLYPPSHPIYLVEWRDTSNILLRGRDSSTLTVSQPGRYYVQYTDTRNGCSIIDSIDIEQDINIPLAEAGPGGELSCALDSIQLDGSGSTIDPNVVYNWSTPNGNLLSGNNSLNPFIDEDGEYIILVTDTTNGCQSTDTVTITKDANQPQVAIATPDVLDCNSTQIQLDGTGSEQGPDIEFEWVALSGNIVSGNNTLQPSVNAAGNYQLIIRNTSNNCESREEVFVTIDTISPAFSLTPPEELNCQIIQTDLQAVLNQAPNNYNINWNTGNGNILSGSNSLNPSVNAPGVYTAEIINLDNGCSSTKDILVSQDINTPGVIASVTDTLNCINSNVQIDANGSSSGANFNIIWSDPNGNRINPADPLNPNVTEAGAYRLVIQNTQNFCKDSIDIEVADDYQSPSVAIANPTNITCSNQIVSIDGSSSSTGSQFGYQWTSANGNIVNGNNTTQANVNAPGWYFLNVVNNRNGCQTIDSVEVFENVDIPTVQISNPDTLDCQNPTLSLDASGSSQGANFIYNWTTPDGSLLSGNQTLNPMVGSAGNYWLIVTDQVNGCKDSLSIEVQVDEDLPIAQVFTPEILTCTTTTVELDGSGSSSGPEFSYSWSTTNGNIVSGINTLNPMVDNPGDYILTIRNTTNACENTVWIEVEENVSNPQISIAPADTLTCSINSFSLSSSSITTASNAAYNWSTTNGNILSGNTTAQPIIDAPGTYELEVTDLENGCTSTNTIQVMEDIQTPLIATNNPEELTCIILKSTLSASATGSGNNFSYNWSTTNGSFVGAINQAQATANAPGFYEVLVTDQKNGCTSTMQVEVTQDVVEPIAIASSTGIITCSNLSVNLDGSGSSTGPDFNYNWTTSNGSLSSGSNTLNPTVVSSGTYQLRVTNTNNGCDEITTVIVGVDSLIPAASITNPGLITCRDSSVILSAQALNGLSNGTFSWASANGQIIGNSNQPIITAGLSGVYELTLTDPDNGCYTKETVQVLEDKQLPTVDAGEQKELNCTDSLLNLVGVATAANGSFDIFWSTSNGNILNGQTTLSPLVNQEGIYILQITDPVNGCISMDQVTVIRDPNILTQVEPRTVEPLCFGDLGSVEIAATVGGTQPFQYSIDNGGSFQNSGFFGNLGAGQYTLLVEDAKGCKAQAGFTIPQLQQNAVELEARIVVQLGDEMTLYPQTNIDPANIGYIEWSPAEGLSCTDCLNPTFIGTSPTTYTVYIEDLNGCGVSDRTTITIEKKFNVYIPSAFSPRRNDGINDSFTIFGDPETITQINTFMVFDRWGEKVFENYNFQPNDPTQGWNGDLRGKLFDSGVFVYFAEIEFIDGTRKIFKGDVTLF